MAVEAEKIRVGVIGASPDRGWAARAHIPALTALPEYELTAVGTSRPESARAAARKFGAAHAFTDARRLAEHPEVDVVAVTVKVPAHAELVGAALAAGKHVYCEWPLATTSEEAAALAAAARGAGVHHAIGLQARYAPALAYARDLVAGGRVGTVLSATVYAARGKGAGGRIPAWAAYTLDRDSAAGMLEVAGGHTLDALTYVLGGIGDGGSGGGTGGGAVGAGGGGGGVGGGGSDGGTGGGIGDGGGVAAGRTDGVGGVAGGRRDGGGVGGGGIRELSADLPVRRTAYTVAETGVAVEATSPDHLLLHATLTGGAVVSAHIHDAKVTEGRTRLEISGTRGDLAVLSTGPTGPAGVQIGGLRLLGTSPRGTYEELPVPARYRLTSAVAPDAEGFNVAQLYAALAADLRTGARTVPGFDAGVHLHRLLDTIRLSAATATRQPVPAT